MQKFCRFLDHGIQYNNNTTNFTIAPCCYFSKQYVLDPNKEVKQQYLDRRREWSSEDLDATCKVCIDQEKAGIRSYRQASFQIVPNDAQKISMVTVAVNKECNLACPQCGSHSSSFWYRENIRHGVEENQQIVDYHVNNHRGKITDQFISLFDNDNFSDINYVKFGGGEPLMTDTHLKIIAKIKNKSKVELQYTSNFSIMPSAAVLNAWKEFKVVKWMASIDGVGEQFSILRWPHTWSKLEDFCNDALRVTPANVVLGIEHTLNMLNAYHYDKMKYWYENIFCRQDKKRKGVFNLHNVIGRLSLSEIPQVLREKILQKYGDDHIVSKTVMDQPVKDYVNSVKYMDMLDQRRSTDWRSAFPEVARYYD